MNQTNVENVAKLLKDIMLPWEFFSFSMRDNRNTSDDQTLN